MKLTCGGRRATSRWSRRHEESSEKAVVRTSSRHPKKERHSRDRRNGNDKKKQYWIIEPQLKGKLQMTSLTQGVG